MCESAGAVHAARTASVLAASRRHVRVCQGGKDDSLLTKQWELQRDGSFQRADMDKLVSLQLWQKVCLRVQPPAHACARACNRHPTRC